MKKLISFFLCLIMITGIIAASAATSFAVVEIVDGDFSYIKASDDSYELYCYYGTDTNITLPAQAFGKNVTAVAAHAFECSGINSVTIPSGYLKINDNAFSECTNLTTVTLPSTITTIAPMAFSNCPQLSNINLSGLTSLKEIGSYAFAGDTMITAVTIPDSVTAIGNYAFSQTSISVISVPDTVTTFGNGVFSSCASLETARIPKYLTKIGEDTFSGCSALIEVNIPEKLETIGDNAFKDCSSLAIIDLPGTLKTIGASAFENDISMTELFIPDSVTAIGGYAFYPMGVQRKPYPDDNESKITITCYKDSYAADYCYENYIWQNENQHAVDKVIGDVDLDGVLIIVDATIIQKYQIGKAEIPTYRAQELADVNRDGKISVRDATLIQMYLANMIDSFDEEEV